RIGRAGGCGRASVTERTPFAEESTVATTAGGGFFIAESCFLIVESGFLVPAAAFCTFSVFLATTTGAGLAAESAFFTITSGAATESGGNAPVYKTDESSTKPAIIIE